MSSFGAHRSILARGEVPTVSLWRKALKSRVKRQQVFPGWSEDTDTNGLTFLASHRCSVISGLLLDIANGGQQLAAFSSLRSQAEAAVGQLLESQLHGQSN